MKKNCGMFFRTAIVSVFAVFLFFIVSFGFFAVPKARAYAIGSASPEAPTPSLNTATGTTSYDFGNSLQNLISPFTGFINSLKFNNNTTLNPGGVSGGINSTSFTLPTINLTPVLETTIQSTLSQWFNQFDNWFYGSTGVQLSGILVAILGVLSWVLGLAQQAVNWLVGVFH